MKYVKTFESFSLTIDPKIPISDQLRNLCSNSSTFKESGKFNRQQEELAHEFIELEDNCDDSKKVVGSDSYNRRLQILKELGFSDTSRFEEIWKMFDKSEGF